MIVTLSDYILEQEVSTAECSDITMEQTLAGIDVASKLWAAYTKQIVMLEYANTYMEADEQTATETKTGEKWYQKAWTAIKNFFKMIGTWFVNRYNDLKKLFSKNKTALDHVDSKMESDAEYAAEVTTEINQTIKTETTGTTSGDISLGTLVYLMTYDKYQSDAIDILLGEETLEEFANIVDQFKEGKFEADNDFAEIYQLTQARMTHFEEIIKTAKSRGKKEYSAEEIKQFVKTVKSSKLLERLDKSIITAKGLVGELHNLQIPAEVNYQTKQVEGKEVVVGAKLDEKTRKIMDGWRKAMEEWIARMTRLSEAFRDSVKAIVNSAATVETAGKKVSKAEYLEKRKHAGEANYGYTAPQQA